HRGPHAALRPRAARLQDGATRARCRRHAGRRSTRMNPVVYREAVRQSKPRRTRTAPTLPGQTVLVLQGGGALGAYQVGVYQAMHEAGIEPDWVIGTSIGAINAALIAGNKAEDRLARLHAFWDHMEQQIPAGPFAWFGIGAM